MSDSVWNVFFVEDNPDFRRDIAEYLQEEAFSFGTLRLIETGDFREALRLLKQRKIDLLILDVLGENGDNEGVDVFTLWKSTGFAPVIFYTALPEVVLEYESPLVRVVGKDSGLSALRDQIEYIFSLRIPQVHRAIVSHFDASLRNYMWGFIVENWLSIDNLVGQPDFLRLLVMRLANQFSRVGIGKLAADLYPESEDHEASQEKVHPAEFYIKPPIGDDPQLGDIRLLGEARDLYVVIWPSCDLVLRDGRCKVDRALCAKALPISSFDEFRTWLSGEGSEGKKREAVGNLKSLLGNNRRGGGQPERYYFLPPAWDIPASVIDFQELEHVDVTRLRESECIATVASPFAEAIGSRFVRYLGRVGTPDLDLDLTLRALSRG